MGLECEPLVRGRIANALATAAAVIVALLLLVRWTGWPVVSPLVQLVAFPQLLWIALLFAAVASLLSRVRSLRWWLLALTVAASWPPLSASPGASDASRDLTVISANVLRGTATEGALALAQAAAAVRAVVAQDPTSYEAEWRHITRRYRAMTAGLLAVSRVPPLRRRLVPTAAALPRAPP